MSFYNLDDGAVGFSAVQLDSETRHSRSANIVLIWEVSGLGRRGLHVEGYMSRVTCRGLHVEGYMSRVTCRGLHVEGYMSRGSFRPLRDEFI